MFDVLSAVGFEVGFEICFGSEVTLRQPKRIKSLRIKVKSKVLNFRNFQY